MALSRTREAKAKETTVERKPAVKQATKKATKKVAGSQRRTPKRRSSPTPKDLRTSDFRKVILPNGVRVLTEIHPQNRAVSCGVWVDRGTRHELPHEAGLAHFVEHLVFKRTKKRSAYKISRDMEAVGGDLNAFTSRENTSFTTHSLKEDVGLSLDVLSDLVCRPSFDPSDIKKEKQVVIQEIHMADDQLEDVIFDSFFELALPNSTLGKPILGSVKSIEDMKRQTIVDFHRRQYNASNILVSVAGNIRHDDVLALVLKHLKPPKPNAAKTEPKVQSKAQTRPQARTRSEIERHHQSKVGSGSRSNAQLKSISGASIDNESITSDSNRPQFEPFRKVVRKTSEQVHILIGLEAPDYCHRLRFAGVIVNTLIGGGLTSRLYQKIREERGLVYSIYSQLTTFQDAGLNLIYASTEPKKMPDVVDLILKDLKKLQKTGVKRSDLELFKTQVKGAILLGADDIENRMNSLAVNELVFGRYRSVDEVMHDVDGVNLDAVHEYIETKMNLDRLGILLMGAVPEEPTRKWLETL